MATYIQGVRSVIPQIQTFTPDLNAHAASLQASQNQYDSNWKALNNMYGQFYYADVSRGSSMEKKEHLIKDIDYNLKRVATLDLSLEQNVTQAKQVFKPFYEDKALMKDMAWTKNYDNQRSRASGLKTAYDKERRTEYWDAGVKELDYRKEEFSATTDEESMSFGNVSYTPYVNTVKEAMKIAKEAGLSVEAPPEFSPDGKWIIRKKNGEALMSPLSKLFEATLGSDPRVQGVYKTQAYVNRKDYSYNNAAQFDGNRESAEMDYLQKNFTMLKTMESKRLKGLQAESKENTARKNTVVKRIEKKTARPGASDYLKALEEDNQLNDVVIAQAEETNELLSNGSSTGQTSTGFNNPYGDLKSLRQKVDQGMSSLLMQKDLGEASYIFAHKDMSVKMDANPYKVLEIKQANRMAAINAKAKADEKNIDRKWGLKSGALVQYEDGSIGRNNELYEGRSFTPTDGSTTETDMTKNVSNAVAYQYNDLASGYVKGVVNMYSEGLKSGEIAPEDGEKTFKAIFGTAVDYEEFREGVTNGGPEYISKLTAKFSANDKDGSTYLSRLTGRANGWMERNKHLSTAEYGFKTLVPLTQDVNLMGENIKSYNLFKEEVKQKVISRMPKGVSPEITEKMFDQDGNLKDIDAVFDALEVAKEYEGPGFMETLWTGIGAAAKESWGQLTGEEVDPMNTYNAYNKAKKYQESFDEKKYQQGWLRKAGALLNLGKYVLPGMQQQAIYQGYDDKQESPMERVKALYAAKQLTDNIENIHGALESGLNNSETYKNLAHNAPFINSIGQGGAGQYSSGKEYDVMPQVWSAPGTRTFNHLRQNFSAIDFAGVKNTLSIDGASTDAYKTSLDKDNVDQRELLEGMMQQLLVSGAHPLNKNNPFRIRGQHIAAGDSDLKAITLIPSRDWLQEFKGGKDAEDEGGFTQTMLNKISSNGITIIGDKDNAIFAESPLLDNPYMDPIKSIVETNKEYTYVDPRGVGDIRIEESELFPGQYSYVTNLNIINDAGEYETVFNTSTVDADTDFLSATKSTQDFFNRQDPVNIRDYNKSK